MLKRVVSLIVGIACLVSMTSVFAASYTGTTTTYTADGKIRVDSSVTATAANDVVTYLVYSQDVTGGITAVTGADVVWADQHTFAAVGENKVFSYVTTADNIGAPIVVGADATAAAGAEDAIPEAAKQVTVVCGDATWTAMVAIPDAENGYCQIPFDAAQSVVESVSVNGTAVTAGEWFTAADAIWVPASLLTEDENTVTVVADGEVSGVVTKTMQLIAGVDGAQDDTRYKSVVVLGNVVGAADEFGILLAYSEADAEAYIAGTDTTKAVKLKALAKNDEGDFAIQVYNEEDFASYENVYAIAYYTVDGTDTYAECGQYVAVQ